MKYPSIIALGVLIFTINQSSCAENSLGFDITGGAGQSGYDTTGKLDVGPDRDWETSLSFAHLHTTIGTASNTNQWTGGMEHEFDPAWESHANVTYWDDTLNDIHYAGPTFGFTYTLKQGGGTSVETPGQKKTTTDELDDDEIINPLEERKKDQTNEAKDLLSISLDTDLFIYGTEVDASSTTRTVLNAKTHRLVTQVVPPVSGTADTTELHPNLTLDVPLFDAAIVPFVTLGHDFYSRDPAALEALAGRPRFTAAAGQLNTLVAGFVENNGSVGFSYLLPWDLLFNASIGTEQLATDQTWATTQSVSLNRTFFDHLKLKLEWDRAIEDGISTDTIIGGMTWKFGD